MKRQSHSGVFHVVRREEWEYINVSHIKIAPKKFNVFFFCFSLSLQFMCKYYVCRAASVKEVNALFNCVVFKTYLHGCERMHEWYHNRVRAVRVAPPGTNAVQVFICNTHAFYHAITNCIHLLTHSARSKEISFENFNIFQWLNWNLDIRFILHLPLRSIGERRKKTIIQMTNAAQAIHTIGM